MEKINMVNIAMLITFDVYFQFMIAIPINMKVKPITIEPSSTFPDKKDRMSVLKNGMLNASVVVKIAVFSEFTRFHR